MTHHDPGQRRLRTTIRLALRSLYRPVLGGPFPPWAQRMWTELLARGTLIPSGVTARTVDMGGVRAERVEADESRAGAVLYLHGGGYVIGSPRAERVLTASLALEGGSVVYALDYRLAPEHPFPAALEDARTAYDAILEDHGGPIAVAGDSAGGGLALSVAVELRDNRVPPPAALLLLCPWLDLTSNGGDAGDRDPLLPCAAVERWASLYLNGADPRDPRSSPLLADLSSLPPTLVHAAGDDPLLADAERFAEDGTAAGSDVELRVFADRWHDFHVHAGVLHDSTAALAEAASFIRSRLTAAASSAPS